MENIAEEYKEALNLFHEGQLDEAAEIFLELNKKNKEIGSYCLYQLARISNMKGDPGTAYSLYLNLLSKAPDIASKLFHDSHKHKEYVFKGLDSEREKERDDCPLCGGQGKSHWCYLMFEAAGFYHYDVNPIRMWLYCEECHHLFARHFVSPVSPKTSMNAPSKSKWMPKPTFFGYYSEILKNIKKYTDGMSLLEIGIGGCECLLAAREIGYEPILGIDVVESIVENAKDSYGLNAETADFNKYKSDCKWDVIIMGDVLEHVDDPVEAIQKAESLLADDGCLWISTPNFESAFSAVAGHEDPMRREQSHLNYFSRKSLYNLLAKFNLVPVEYAISRHYNGSMEIIAVKESKKPTTF